MEFLRFLGRQTLLGKAYALETPSREVYMKGPGMIFKGNPKNWLTEIQFIINTQSERQ